MSSTDLKVARLPEEPEMRRRLPAVIGDEYLASGLCPHLLQKSGAQLNGVGVVLAVDLAIEDYLARFDPRTATAMRMYIKALVKPLVEALVDDDEVRADALRFIDKVESVSRQQLHSSPPTPPRPELTEASKVSLMRHIKRLAKLYDEYTDDPRSLSADYRAGGVNPCYDQTLNGLFLEFSYGSPRRVWTPWGSWHFAAAQSYQTDIEAFMSRLSVREHIKEQDLEWGTYGPVYAILAIDGEELPEPVIVADASQCLDYYTAKAEWERLYMGR